MNETERKWLQQYKKLSPENVISEFLRFLGEAWENKKTLFTSDDSEVRITGTLCTFITQKTRHPSTLTAWGIHYEPQISEELKSGLGHVIGRCDIIISVASQVYICECKRIFYNNSNFTDSARLYVKQGMWRFLKPSETQETAEPQYPTWLGFAGMIGYVMDGTVACACDALIVAIKKHAHPISISSPYPSDRPSQNAEYFHTEHKNCVQQDVIMHHIALGL